MTYGGVLPHPLGDLDTAGAFTVRAGDAWSMTGFTAGGTGAPAMFFPVVASHLAALAAALQFAASGCRDRDFAAPPV